MRGEVPLGKVGRAGGDVDLGVSSVVLGDAGLPGRGHEVAHEPSYTQRTRPRLQRARARGVGMELGCVRGYWGTTRKLCGLGPSYVGYAAAAYA